MRYARLLMLFAIVVSSPATAFADSGWWAWLEEMSGPGVFGGYMHSVPVRCWTMTTNGQTKKSAKTTCGGDAKTLNATEPIVWTVRVTGGVLSSFNFPRQKVGYVPPPAGTPSSNNDPVYALPAMATFTVRTGRAWEFGTGAGSLFFWGKDVNSHARLIATPVTASWRFLVWNEHQDTPKRQRWAVEGQTYLIVAGFHATSFSNIDNGFRTAKVELQGSIGVSYTFRGFRAERR